MRFRTLLAILLVGCSGEKTPPAEPDAAAPPAPSPGARQPPPAQADDARPPPPDKKPRLKEPAVFVDGVPYGIITYGELPPTLKTLWVRAGDKDVRRFSLYDYLVAIGVPLAKAKEVHLYGGRRVARVPGDEFRRFRKELLFAFTMGTRGKPELLWPNNKPVKGKVAIDMLTVVAVYVEKEPPATVDAFALQGVPYQADDVRGGVRVYRDGRLLATIKRNNLAEKALVPGSDVAGDPRWTLVPYLESLGVSFEGVQTVDLILDEWLEKRIKFKDLKDATFSAIPDQGGKVLLHPSETKVSAILLYASQKPPSSR